MRGNYVAKHAHRLNKSRPMTNDYDKRDEVRFVVTIFDHTGDTILESESFASISDALVFQIEQINKGNSVSIRHA